MRVLSVNFFVHHTHRRATQESALFESITPAPPDPILGLTEAFNNDTRPGKVNLGVGVYLDDSGQVPLLQAVHQAEQRLLETSAPKGYLPIPGSSSYGRAVRRLLLGADDARMDDGRAVTCQCPGGTGALRVTADYLKQKQGVDTIHVSDPTWANHQGIFKAAGLNVKTYDYFDPTTHGLNIDVMLNALGEIPAGDAALFHVCCHNPTGVDPSVEQWQAIADVLATRGVLPVLDFAYQGFGDGLEEDAAGLRTMAAALPELLVCSSFSKNFSLYNERVGALTIMADTPEKAVAVLSHVKRAIRTNYSNPPAHGGMIVQTILDDAALTEQWHTELAQMRQRINQIRQAFCDKLDQRGVQLSPQGNGFIARQRGMFSFSGLI